MRERGQDGITGDEEETIAQVRADALTSMTKFLRSARLRDVALLTWIEGSNGIGSNNTAKDVFAKSDNVKELHRIAINARRLYAKKGAGASALEQLDDEALSSVPEYGKTLVEDPISDSQCQQVYDLVKQCPSHFGCIVAEESRNCLSCSTHGPCSSHG